MSNANPSARSKFLHVYCWRRYAKAMRTTYETDYALLQSSLGTANHIVVNAEVLERGNKSTRMLELRRIVDFVLEDATDITHAQLLDAFVATDDAVHSNPFKDELTFEEAFTKTLRIRFWRTFGNVTAALGNYYPPEWIF